MDLIDRIGPVLGIVAFFGLSVLAFLIFQQSRDVRRLREWAGRAPERAREAADASLAAAEARGETAAGAATDGRLAHLRSRIADLRARLGERMGPSLREADRRLPVDWRYLAAALLVVIVAAGVLTSGFGIVGGDDGGGSGTGGGGGKPKVAVLNATQAAGTPVAGLAHEIATKVVKPAGYRVAVEDNAPAGLSSSTVMYSGAAKDAADELAKRIRAQLGDTSVQPMTSEVETKAKRAKVALLVGLDDSTFGQ